jgi:hypothetical protein
MPTPPSTQEDRTPDFLHDGSIKTTTGSSNVLIVAPNLCPSTQEGSFVAWLALQLVESLGAYGIINCQRYRKPLEGDSSPDELWIPDTGPKDQRYKEVMQIRNKLLNETGGIPVNLNSYASASVAAYEYVESIWLAAGEIGWKAVPLVLFVQGMDDATADDLDLDVAIGAGCISDEEDPPGDDDLTARAELVDKFLWSLHLSRPELRIREGVAGYALEAGDAVAWWLRRTWNDQYDPASENSWRAPEVNCLLLTFRFSSLRENMLAIENIGRSLAEVIKNMGEFQSIASNEKGSMAKQSRKSNRRGKSHKEESAVVAQQSPKEVLEPEVLPTEEISAPATSGAQGKHAKKGASEDQLVRDALDFISDKANEMVYKGSIEIGDYILEKFFGGDIERAKSKKPTKRSSYIALCRHKELVVHPATLGIMVRVAAQEKFFAAKKLPTDKLSYSHKAELVKLEDDQEKAKLFKEAVSKSLSVRELADSVRQSKNTGRTKVGQNLPSGRQGVFNPELLLKNPVLADENKLRELQPEDLKGLLSEVTETLNRLSSYVAEYDRIRERLETISQEGAEKHRD